MISKKANKNPSSKAQLFLGVDGGASKTEADLIDGNKRVIGRGSAAGSNAHVYGHKKALDNVYLAVKQALGNKSDQVIACLAIAGINQQKNKETWTKEILSDKRFNFFKKPPLLVNDTVAALRSGTTDPNAIAIIAGTGSNCYGRNKKGQEAISGGGDYILGDQGSAYDIGLKILKSVTKELDGRGEKTQLTDLLFNQLKINSLDSLKLLVYKKPWNKADIAKIAPLIDIAEQKDDKTASQITDQTVFELSIKVKAVAARLDLTNKSYTVVPAGSVFKVKKIRDGLEAEVKKFSPKAKFEDQKIDSATAAAYLALET